MSNAHDHNIANQNGADFRSDLNNVLGDIQSTNAGPNEPTTKVAYKIWIDTTNNRVKIRNGANNAWIDLGSSTAEMGHATSASPSLTGTVNSAGDIVCNSNGRIKLPVGTTGQRPSSPATGDIRYNSTLNRQEIYNGSDWVTGTVPSGGSANNVIKNDGSGGVSWDTVESILGFPSQSGNGGKTLTTNGSVLSWALNSVFNSYTFDYTGSSQTWTKPTSGNLALIFIWGGGGSGATNDSGSGDAGGGGGGCCFGIFPLSQLSSTVSISIGAGGYQSGNDNGGVAGGNSTFGAAGDSYYLKANGGEGGVETGRGGYGGQIYDMSYANPSNPTIGGFAGGQGGQHNVTSDHGDAAIFGGAGGANGNQSSGAYSVMGGRGGRGGSGSSTNGTGGDGTSSTGSVPGGGGGGRANNGSPYGSGGNGQCKIYVI